MKNILFIETQKYPEAIGGAEVFDYYLIRGLSKFFKIFYISSKPWKNSNLTNLEIITLIPLS